MLRLLIQCEKGDYPKLLRDLIEARRAFRDHSLTVLRHTQGKPELEID